MAALSARASVSYVSAYNGVLDTSALASHLGLASSSSIVALCGDNGCVTPSNTSDGYQIQEHVIGFRDSGAKTGTQYAYEFSAQASSVASRKLGYATVKTYLPNGKARSVVDLFNTCPGASPAVGLPAISCTGRGSCTAAGGGLNRCVCVSGFEGDDCSKGVSARPGLHERASIRDACTCVQ